MDALTDSFFNGKLDLEDVRELEKSLMKLQKRKECLSKHAYKIYQGKDGRYFTRFPKKGGGSYQKAFRSLEDVEDAVVAFYENQDDDLLIKELFYAVMDEKLEEGSITESTVTRNTYDFIRFFSEFGEYRISDIREEDVERFIRRQKVVHQLDTKSYAHLLSVTRIVFKYARKKKLVAFRIDDVISDMDWGRNAFRKPEKLDEDEVFSDEEAEKICEYFKANPNGKHLGLLLCFATGLRIGELAALKWSDILEDSIRVCRTERTYSDKDHKFHCEVIDLPKTKAGARIVPIPEKAEWIIDELRRLSPDSEFVFTFKGSRTRTVYFRKAMAKACDAAGVPRKSPHKIRKTYASILLDNNVGNKAVIENMGHTDISTTNGFYARRRRSTKQRVDVVNGVPEFDMVAKK